MIQVLNTVKLGVDPPEMVSGNPGDAEQLTLKETECMVETLIRKWHRWRMESIACHIAELNAGIPITAKCARFYTGYRYADQLRKEVGNRARLIALLEYHRRRSGDTAGSAETMIIEA